MKVEHDILTDEDRGALTELTRRLEPHVDAIVSEWTEAWLQGVPVAGADPSAYRQMVTYTIERTLRTTFGHIAAGDFRGCYEFQYTSNREYAHSQVPAGEMPLFSPHDMYAVSRLGHPIMTRWIARVFGEDRTSGMRAQLAQERFGSQMAEILADAYSDEREARLRSVGRKLQAALAQSERANRAKSEFIAAVAHEIRSPLSALLGYVDLLRDGSFGELPSQQHEIIDRLKMVTQSTLHLLGDLLEHARVDAGMLPVRPETIGLQPVFDELAGMAQGLLREQLVTLRVQPPHETLTVHADPLRLRQILTNLVSNAVKFTDRGRISVTAAALDAGRVQIRVRDTGTGIHPNDLPRIFDLFYRAETSATVAGAGIGLSLSRRLAQSMGGELSVESVLGEGSTFTLTLPRPTG